MIGRIFPVFLTATLCFGCATIPAAAAKDISSQAELDAISEKCKSPKEWLIYHGPEIQLKLPDDASFELADCILYEIKMSRTTKFGFVGNEAVGATEE